MNTNNGTKCVSTLGLVMGIFMLMTVGAPSAHAGVIATELLAYWNFNDPAPDFASDLPGLETGILIQNGPTNPFPTSTGPTGGHFNTDGVDAGAVNKAAGDTSTGLNSLDVGGNTSTMGGTGEFCFTTQAINTMGTEEINVSFALESVGNNNQFSELQLFYSTTSQTSGFTQYADIAITNGLSGSSFVNNFTTFKTTGGSFTLGAPTTTLFLEFCFLNQTDNADPNHTYLDNIQVVGVIPEPSTYIGGLLGVLGLCWYERRRLIRSLRLRRA